MFVANPTDPSLPVIRYIGEPGPSSPVRRQAPSTPRDDARRWRLAPSRRGDAGRLQPAAGIVLAAALAAFGAGYGVHATISGPAAMPRAMHAVSVRPMPGEFRLAPGNLQPPGIMVPVRSSRIRSVPGEFRLAPGNLQPPGVTGSARAVSTSPMPGEFRLAPGNLPPPGDVVDPAR